MANRDKQKAEEEVRLIEYTPPKGQEDRPPQFANIFTISGGTDAIVITFYHISPSTMSRVFGRNPKWDHVERSGDAVTVRSEPIARVALPLSVCIDLVADMFDTIVSGIPEIQGALGGVPARFASVLERVTSLSNQNKIDSPKSGS